MDGGYLAKVSDKLIIQIWMVRFEGPPPGLAGAFLRRIGTSGRVRAILTRQPGPPVPPLRLSDDELTAVMAAARPLPVGSRDAFLQSVAHELQGCGEIGPGIVHQVCREQQRAFMGMGPHWPDLSNVSGPGHGTPGVGHE